MGAEVRFGCCRKCPLTAEHWHSFPPPADPREQGGER